MSHPATLLTHPDLQHSWRRVRRVTRQVTCQSQGWLVETDEVGPDQHDRWSAGKTLVISDQWVAQAEALAAARSAAEAEAETLRSALLAAGARPIGTRWSVTVEVTQSGLEARTPAARYSVAHRPNLLGDLLADRAKWLADAVHLGAVAAARHQQDERNTLVSTVLEAHRDLTSTRTVSGFGGGTQIFIGDTLVAERRQSHSVSREDAHHAAAWGYEARPEVSSSFVALVAPGELERLIAAKLAADAAAEAERQARADAQRAAARAAYDAEIAATEELERTRLEALRQEKQERNRSWQRQQEALAAAEAVTTYAPAEGGFSGAFAGL
jgi:hypothetical protein